MVELTKSAPLPYRTSEEDSYSPVRMDFTGSGSEYFRIWIVNLLLTIVTLGIYSAWAKVRRMRYFYDNTQLDGSSFEYHGNPIAILKGRIVAVILFGGYNAAIRFYPAVGLVILVLLMGIVPWLIWKSLQFKLYNSSYRGIRFGFRGSVGQAYKAYLLMPLMALFTLYFGLPFAHQRIKKFQHDESRYGNTHFSFDGSVGSFYKTYLIGFGVAIAGIVVLTLSLGLTAIAGWKSGGAAGAAAAGASFGLFLFALYAWMFSIYPLFLTMIQNLIWSNTKLGAHQFSSDMQWTKMTFIVLTNLLGIIFTLGLFIPFAHIRTLKYRIESTSLIPDGSLDDFCTATQNDIAATGEGMADFLDFDLSL